MQWCTEMHAFILRIDYCDQRRFWECSHISGDSCMIWTHYTSLEASEFSRSYHITKTITSLNVDSLIGSKLPKIKSTCLTAIIGLEIYLEHKQLQ